MNTQTILRQILDDAGRALQAVFVAAEQRGDDKVRDKAEQTMYTLDYLSGAIQAWDDDAAE